MILLISEIIRELTHTEGRNKSATLIMTEHYEAKRTLFPYKGIIPVIGIVCITRRSTSTITKDPEVEF